MILELGAQESAIDTSSDAISIEKKYLKPRSGLSPEETTGENK